MERDLNTLYLDENIVITNDTGYGFRLGKYKGNDRFGYRNQYIPIDIMGGGSTDSPQLYTDPTWTQIGGSPFHAYAFAVNNAVMLPVLFPHDIVPSSDVYFAVHWIQDSGASPQTWSTAAVTWQFEYMYAKGFNQAAFDPTVWTDSPAASPFLVRTSGSATPYQHMTSVTDAVSSLASDPGGLCYLKLKRITNPESPNADNTNTILALAASMIYQSTNLAVKQRSPSWWAD